MKFGATVAINICISNASACQIKTIIMLTSLAKTAVNMKKLALKELLNITRHPQLRHPRNHAFFGKFHREQIDTLQKFAMKLFTENQSSLILANIK